MPLGRRLFLSLAALLPAAGGPAAAPPPPRRLPAPPGRAPDEVWDVLPGRPPGGEVVAAWARRNGGLGGGRLS